MLQQTSSEEPSPVDASIEQQRGPIEHAVAATGGSKPPSGEQSSRHLVIRILEGGEVRANVRIPLRLARAAEKFIPREGKAHLMAQGIDVEEILGELTGDEPGPIVQVDEDGKSVFIAVE